MIRQRILPLHQISICMSPCCLFLPAYIYMKKKVALEQQDSCILCCCCCQCYYTTPITTAVCDSFVFFFHTCIYVIKRAGLVMVFGKKRKTSFFFLLTLFYSFSLSLSLSPPLFRSYLIDAIFDDDVLSLFSFSCRWDSICSLKKPILNELWFDEDRKRKNETR